jgi:hypothetical protein
MITLEGCARQQDTANALRGNQAADGFSQTPEAIESASQHHRRSQSELKQRHEELRAIQEAGADLADSGPERERWLRLMVFVQDALDEAGDEALELNSVESRYHTDIAVWFRGLSEDAKSLLAVDDRRTLPSGPGWIVRIEVVYGGSHASGEAPPEIRQTLSRLRSPNAEEHGISHSTIVETAEAADGNEAFFVEFAVEDGAQRLGSRPVAEREQRIAHP